MTEPFLPLSAADIAADRSALDVLDTLVLADVAAPADPGGQEYDRAAYWRNIQDWLSRGGNLVLTDKAIEALAKMGIVGAADVIAVNSYLPYTDVQDLSHAMTDGVRANGRQLVESAVLGWGILGSETRPQTIAVGRAAWEGLGGTVVGTTGTNNVSVGQARFGKGQIRIIGGALPMPIENNDHRYGLRDYAMTYTGLYLLENSIEYDHPDLGNEPARLGTRLDLAGSAGSGDYTDEAVLTARLEDVRGNALDGAVVTFDLLSGGETVDSWTAATGSDGVATVPARLLVRPGGYTLAARYGGDAENYRPASVSAPFAVTREDVAMTLEKSGVGASSRVVARLLDADAPGAAVSQRTVQFTADGSQELGADVTDGEGFADVAIPPGVRGGRHTFTADFAGDEWFEPASQSTSSR